MKKLISRNPIQRFKDGRKIYKADKGTTITYTPGIVSNDGKFTATGTPTQNFSEVKQTLLPLKLILSPGTFNTNITYNRGNIRSNRGINYSNVDEYWDYLNNNRDSNDFKLWSNIMRTTDGNLNREAYDLIMNQYGIKGNLGRRDSRRLANLLNDLNSIGAEGSDARNAFIDSYNETFDLAKENRKKLLWDILVRPEFKYANYPNFRNFKYNFKFESNFLPKLVYKKGGTFPLRNLIKRFKNGEGFNTTLNIAK